MISEACEAASEGDLIAGSPYLIMELLDAAPVYRSGTQLTWAQVSTILRSLLSALAHAHARGVIHRDIKPANVLRHPRTGEVVLTDFGIARIHQPTNQKRASSIAGTAAYMAPEQFTGDPLKFGPWTDLYQLGCLAYELVSGAPPFGLRGDPSTFATAHCFHKVPPLSSCAGLPDGFELWLDRLLAKDERRRFQHAADAAHALAALGDAVDAPMPTQAEKRHLFTALATAVTARAGLSAPREALPPRRVGTPAAEAPTSERQGLVPLPETWRAQGHVPTPATILLSKMWAWVSSG